MAEDNQLRTNAEIAAKALVDANEDRLDLFEKVLLAHLGERDAKFLSPMADELAAALPGDTRPRARGSSILALLALPSDQRGQLLGALPAHRRTRLEMLCDVLELQINDLLRRTGEGGLDWTTVGVGIVSRDGRHRLDVKIVRNDEEELQLEMDPSSTTRLIRRLLIAYAKFLDALDEVGPSLDLPKALAQSANEVDAGLLRSLTEAWSEHVVPAVERRNKAAESETEASVPAEAD